ncbi:hypothetical protein EYR41_007635 [Orbilia oligospora]|uniref:lytic cellulose monooxygenase (C4-dehydrogenating) n=1 Tax=Orbilia oligospora TaxID=2813651 RepID=A0A8H2E172_ORBOL|nr:hypothetical protein EYR41_007635 [Orbilia oligospora]
MGMERSMMGRSRSLIKFRTTEISGEPCRRPNQILSDIALSIMGREYNHKCDYIHYAADYDTEEKKKFYFLVDWGASLQNRNEGQDDIHLKAYEVKYQDGECSFKAINIPANSFVSRRPWGGGELEWNYRAKMDIMDAASELCGITRLGNSNKNVLNSTLTFQYYEMKPCPAVGLTLGWVSLAQAGLLDNVLAPASSAGLLDSIVGGGTSASSRVWQMLSRGPVSDIMSNAIACNQPDGTSWPVAATVKAGGSITFDWPGWPSNYKGPSLSYLAYCSSGDCSNENPNLLDFFKIDEDGLHDDGSWASDSIAAGSGYTINIPSNIASGSYMMRHEFVNLDGASLLNGAKFYPMCASLKVTGGGSARPSDTVRFPGAYTSLDPGILVTIGNLLGSNSYIFPGPPLISGAGSRASITATARTTTSALRNSTGTVISVSTTSLSGTSTKSSSAAATSTKALVPAYGQCGGLTYLGATECVPGYICSVSNSFYSQCVPDPNSSSSVRVSTSSTVASTATSSIGASTSSTSTTSSSSTALASAYAQCGGLTYIGPTECVAGYYCSKSNSFYSQCIPSPNTAVVVTSSTSTTGTSGISSIGSSTSSSSPTVSKTSSSLSTSSTAMPAAAYAQCGGLLWTGATTCVTGYWCSKSSDYYSQCIPGTDPNASSTTATSKVSASSVTSASSTSSAASTPAAAAYAQCGGLLWTGATTCVTGYYCSKSNDYYSQCIPGTDPNASVSTSASTSKASTSSGTSSATTGTSLSLPNAVTGILSATSKATTSTTATTATGITAATSKASTTASSSGSSSTVSVNTAIVGAYAQCGGINYSGGTRCEYGWECVRQDDYYSQCKPAATSVPLSTASVNTATVGAYAQCGGVNYSGGTRCEYGWECVRQDDYYSQCKPASTSVPLSTSSSSVKASSLTTTSSSVKLSSTPATSSSIGISSLSVNTAIVAGYTQCGGIGYTGGTKCEYGWECVRQDDYYSQCKPAATSVPLSTSRSQTSSVPINTATVGSYAQCGGINYTGGTRCEYGWECVRQDDYYSQCKPAATSVPLSTSSSRTSSLSINTATVGSYAQCGGINYSGGTRCEYGWECVRQDDYYSQCKPAPTSVPLSTSSSSVSANTVTVGSYAQCGGIGYTGGTRCESGWECVRQDDYYSQCKPAATSVPLPNSTTGSVKTASSTTSSSGVGLSSLSAKTAIVSVASSSTTKAPSSASSSSASVSVSSLSVNTAIVSGYSQCGGIGYIGGTQCEYGWECARQDDYYSQCKPAATSTPRSSSTSTASINTATVGSYAQCGGIGYTGGTRCEYGWECIRQDDWYSQCKPATKSVPTTSATSSSTSSRPTSLSSAGGLLNPLKDALLSTPTSVASTTSARAATSMTAPASSTASVNTATVGAYAQCGGINYSGGTRCEYGWECVRQDDYYSQCKPAATSVPLSSSTTINTATVGAYAQCGGINYSGGNRCENGWECVRQDDYYSQCKPAATSTALSTSLSANNAIVAGYAQCGGINYIGGTKCPYGWECVRQDDYYSQCKPAATSVPSTTGAPAVTSSSSATTSKTTSTSRLVNSATVAGYAQCGGVDYTGGTNCPYGWECVRQDDYYSQCKPAATSVPLSTSTVVNTATVAGYAQCGGINYSGGTRCPYGWECIRQDDYYSQCKPAATSIPSTTSAAAASTTPKSSSSTSSLSTSTKLSVNLNIVSGYSQCGGIGYLGGTVCEFGWECIRQDDWYSQCKPAASSTPSSTTTTTTNVSVRSASSTSSAALAATTSTTPKSSTTSASSTRSTTSTPLATLSFNLNIVSGYSQCGGIGYTGGTVCEYGWECIRQDDYYSQCKPAATSTPLSTESLNTATVGSYEQCGGVNYNGGTSCPYGWECVKHDDYYSQCKPASTSKPLTTSTPTTSSTALANTATVGAYAQCGGINYSGGTRCEYGWECVKQDDYYSQCKPASTSKPLTTSTASVNTATVGAYAQCGGINYSGGTRCEYGWECIRQDDYYSQCKPAATSKPLTTSTPTSTGTTSTNTATVGAYAQCGGINYSGGTRCEYGWECIRQDDYYSQCKPAATSVSLSTSTPTSSSILAVNTLIVGAYAQCGGNGYTGGTRCENGYECVRQDDWYSQCKPAATSATPTPTTPSKTTTSSSTPLPSTTSSSGKVITSSSSSSSTSTSSSSTSSTSSRATTTSTTSTSPTSTVPNSTRVTTTSSSSSSSFISSSSLRITSTSTTSTTSSSSTTSRANTITVAGWGQCGGIGWTGGTSCPYGWECSRSNDYYSQCIPAATSKPLTTTTSTTSTAPAVNTAAVAAWAQCGGVGYTGGTVCPKGYSCYYMGDWYSQCWPSWMVGG